jgi:ABC-type ATPase involved in cell division
LGGLGQGSLICERGVSTWYSLRLLPALEAALQRPARAMVKRPRLLLADAPTGQFDTRTARQVRMAADSGVLIASHDEALTEIAGRVLQIQDGMLVGWRGVPR